MTATARPARIGDITAHERGFVSSAIEATKRERWQRMLTTNREKVLATLDQMMGIDFKHLTRVRSLMRDEEIAAVIEILLQEGAPREAYAISGHSAIDGRFIPLEETIEQIHGYGIGTFLSCIPGKLGYFDFEGKNERYILRKPAKAGA